MSLESVRAFFAAKAPDIAVIESPMSSATVAEGSTHSAVRIAPSRMAELTAAEWVDIICQDPS